MKQKMTEDVAHVVCGVGTMPPKRANASPGVVRSTASTAPRSFASMALKVTGQQLRLYYLAPNAGSPNLHPASAEFVRWVDRSFSACLSKPSLNPRTLAMSDRLFGDGCSFTLKVARAMNAIIEQVQH